MKTEAPAWLGAEQASARLGVRRATLYAYVSRGLVRARSQDGVRTYSRADLDVLCARSQARRGHAAVAGGALRFGEPVLDTLVSSVDLNGPRYRGHSAPELARNGVTAERVAELLWTGELPADQPKWPKPHAALLDPGLRSLAQSALSKRRPLELLLLVVACAEVDRDEPGVSEPTAELQRARRWVRSLAVAPALLLSQRALNVALRAPRLAQAFLTSLGAECTPKRAAAVDQALVLIADHELNASAFAARVAASAGADLPRCLLAALATLSGARHGGICDHIEAIQRGFAAPEAALSWVRGELAARRALPGFGHPLYPAGDPREPPLFELSQALGKNQSRVRAIAITREGMAIANGERATVDLGLVSLCAALDLPDGAASGLFALGRSLGYIAHVLEQREQGYLLRPRARYVGS